MDDLKGRVREVTYDPVRRVFRYRCRAATLDGKAVDFDFTLDDRVHSEIGLIVGSRVTYSTHGRNGVWGVALANGWPPIPVDGARVTKAEDPDAGVASYRDALGLVGPPPLTLVERAQREASAMGFTVEFTEEDGMWCVVVHVPGRGATKHHKEPGAAWDEVMTAAGLGGTI